MNRTIVVVVAAVVTVSGRVRLWWVLHDWNGDLGRSHSDG